MKHIYLANWMGSVDGGDFKIVADVQLKHQSNISVQLNLNNVAAKTAVFSVV